MISVEEWNARIDAFIEEENKKAGRTVPVYRICCQDDTDRSGGGIYNETVTVDTIGRFARALGDSNPLFSDPRYQSGEPGGAGREPFQAPPLLECCICSTFIGGKMPRLRGISVFDAGTRWERFLPIRPGDSFSARTTFLGVWEITKKKTAGETMIQKKSPGETITKKQPAGKKPAAPPAGVSAAEPASAPAVSASASASSRTSSRLLIREHRIDLMNQRGEHVSSLTARSIIKCAAPKENNRTSENAGQVLQSRHNSLQSNPQNLSHTIPENSSQNDPQNLSHTIPENSSQNDPRNLSHTIPENSLQNDSRNTIQNDPQDSSRISVLNGRPHYTEEELERVYANLDAQLSGAFRRGAMPRYWEDVEIGEEVPEEIVGPYDESDGQALMAAIGAANAFATKWAAIRFRKGQGITDPETGAHRHPIDRHNSDIIAGAQGLPRAIASGIHSQALLAKSLSDWMGDAGFLRILDCRCRRPLYFGDLSFQRGHVAGKYEKDGKYYVDLDMEAVRQDGIVHTTARGVVELPSRTGSHA